MSSVNSLLQFIDQSPTAFHAVASLEKTLMANNYIKLDETKSWELETNTKYFVTRSDASTIIFHTPHEITENTSFKIIGSHTDSPCLKVKSNPLSQKEGFQLLNVEIYGGVLLTSWFDKDLLLGGRVFIEDEKGKLSSKLITIDKKLRIPRLAIHLERNVNKEGFKVNPQEQMSPIMGLDSSLDFESWILKETGLTGTILSWDLFLFDAEKSSLGGMEEEFIYAPRLDNLASVHASFEALIQAENHKTDFQLAACFQHEEIGSTSQNGAESNFIEATLQRINAGMQVTDDFYSILARSFFISTDMTHAVHPNYVGQHDPNHKPMLNKGPVIKSNANMRYATDGFSIALFKRLCKQANVPFQDFHTRNDMGCGSTIGPMVASKLGIPTIDIGNAMLSMHSIREMSGTKDHDLVIEVFKTFYKNS